MSYNNNSYNSYYYLNEILTEKLKTTLWMSVAYFHPYAQHVFWLFIIDYQFTTGNYFEIKQ